MEDCRVCDILNNHLHTLPSTSQPLWSPNSSPSFHGCPSMVKFEDIESGESNEEKPLIFGQGECNEEMEECFHQQEKKRRLRSDQVQFLEKSFEVENKLDPDRKIQLAKQVGLQPRQVAIWFQNRRARYKTKLLEREYDSLKSAYDKLKADYDTLHSDNDKLKHKVDLLREKAMSGEAASPTKSDVLDSDSPSPHCCSTDGSALMEKKSGWIPKVEDECYDDLQPNSGNFGYPVQDQGTWLWD